MQLYSLHDNVNELFVEMLFKGQIEKQIGKEMQKQNHP